MRGSFPPIDMAEPPRIDGVELDPVRRTLSRGGVAVRLRSSEWGLAVLLARRFGRPVSGAAILDWLYGDREDGGPDWAADCVRAFVCRLRAALRKIGAPVEIVTVWGGGYGMVWRLPRGEACDDAA